MSKSWNSTPPELENYSEELHGEFADVSINQIDLSYSYLPLI